MKDAKKTYVKDASSGGQSSSTKIKSSRKSRKTKSYSRKSRKINSSRKISSRK
jgi:hypothetical protein